MDSKKGGRKEDRNSPGKGKTFSHFVYRRQSEFHREYFSRLAFLRCLRREHFFSRLHFVLVFTAKCCVVQYMNAVTVNTRVPALFFCQLSPCSGAVDSFSFSPSPSPSISGALDPPQVTQCGSYSTGGEFNKYTVTLYQREEKGNQKCRRIPLPQTDGG